eukprot:11667024-Ditylum_brightwellii.AAC.1
MDWGVYSEIMIAILWSTYSKEIEKTLLAMRSTIISLVKCVLVAELMKMEYQDLVKKVNTKTSRARKRNIDEEDFRG